MDELLIRQARPADHTTIVAVFNQAFKGHLAEHQLETLASLRGSLHEVTILVGCIRGNVVGIAYLKNLDNQGVYFSTLAILPAHQNHGLGRDFVGQIFAELRRLGKRWVAYMADAESEGTHQIGRQHGAVPLPIAEKTYLIKLQEGTA